MRKSKNEAKNIQIYGAVYLTVDLKPWKKAAKILLDDMVCDELIPPELFSAITSCSVTSNATFKSVEV